MLAALLSPGRPPPVGMLPGSNQGQGVLQAGAGMPELPGPVALAPAVVKPAALSPLWGAWLIRMGDHPVGGWPCGGDGVLCAGGFAGACSSEGGPGIMELLNSASDVAEVAAVWLWMLEEDLAEVEPVFGSLLPGKHLGL